MLQSFFDKIVNNLINEPKKYIRTKTKSAFDPYRNFVKESASSAREKVSGFGEGVISWISDKFIKSIEDEANLMVNDFENEVNQSFDDLLDSFFGEGKQKLDQHLNKQFEQQLEQQFNIRSHNKKFNFNFHSAQYGEIINLTYGLMKLRGKIIWSDQMIIREYREQKIIPKGQMGQIINNEIYYIYYLSFAMMICEGEINDISRVWYKNKLIKLSKYNYRLYKGCENQQTDPLIAGKSGGAPAYRGMCYIVFDSLPLADFDNQIPDFYFEVKRIPNIENDHNIANKIKNLIIIPGCGEFVYDTKIQYKNIMQNRWLDVVNPGYKASLIAEKPINNNNFISSDISDASLNLQQLKTTCKNVKWVSPVVCWFGSDLDIAKCTISPAVEYRESEFKNISNLHDKNINEFVDIEAYKYNTDKRVDFSEFSEEWKVAAYDRESASLIGRDKYDRPLYGGTINDASIIRYLTKLKEDGYNIMFYPMILMDINDKPWRGRLTGNSKDIHNFFHKKQGYNEFILHYANLVKDHVDAFLIGSEFIGLTSITTDDNKFPVVDELINLAALVRKILPEHVKISYAADWSEYHHTEGGWYNLDSLWANENIDFIGIDAYFPITDSKGGYINSNEIKSGFESGECFDYYYDNDKKHNLTPEYAIKNIEWWWNNKHVNPDGETTNWVPKSKSIWFTEYGFPSVDQSTNQPNKFYDPNCIDGAVPKFSSEEIDVSIQKRAINAFIDFYSQKEFIEEMFLWCWDARPSPMWPHSNLWADSLLWSRGHWINEKLDDANVGSILLELISKTGFNIDKVNISEIDDYIAGMLLNRNLSASEVIDLLRANYFLDIKIENNILCFCKRHNRSVIPINDQYLVSLGKEQFLSQIDIPNILMHNKISVSFIEFKKDYKLCNIFINNSDLFNQDSINGKANQQKESYQKILQINMPIMMTVNMAKTIANNMIKNIIQEKRVINFSLAIEYLKYHNIKINIGSFIKLKYKDYPQIIARIIEITEINCVQKFVAVLDNQNIYNSNYKQTEKSISCDSNDILYQMSDKTKITLVNIPLSIIWKYTNNYNLLSEYNYLLCSLNNDKKLYIEEQNQYIRNTQNICRLLYISNIDKTIEKDTSNNIATDFSDNFLFLDKLTYFIIESDFDLENIFSLSQEIDRYKVVLACINMNEFINFNQIILLSDDMICELNLNKDINFNNSKYYYKISNICRGAFASEGHIYENNNLFLQNGDISFTLITSNIIGLNADSESIIKIDSNSKLDKLTIKINDFDKVTCPIKLSSTNNEYLTSYIIDKKIYNKDKNYYLQLIFVIRSNYDNWVNDINIQDKYNIMIEFDDKLMRLSASKFEYQGKICFIADIPVSSDFNMDTEVKVSLI